MACTGDQANQLHQTETGATSLLYRTQAIAPYTAVPPALLGKSPAISAKVIDWMKPSPIETIHTTHEGRPTVAATAPMENSTSGGTPLATQKAPVQSMPRSRPD